MKLNDVKCRAALPKDKPYKLTDGRGLYLLINPNSSKYWRYNYKINDKGKTYAIGVYPETSLLEARERHKEAHKMVSEGIDPGIAKIEQKAMQGISDSNTFEEIAREWLELKESEVTKNTYNDIKNRLELNLFPIIGKLPIKSVTAPILINALKKVEKRGALYMVKRLRQSCGQIFRFAISHGKVEFNPTNDIVDVFKTQKTRHHKSMPIDLLPEFLRKIDSNEARLYKQTCLALKLMVLTFTRKKELMHSRWEEINMDKKIWTLPAERMKMRRDHLVPLSEQSVKIFRELQEISGDREYVFPSLQKPKKPMHEDTILRAIYSMGYKGAATIHGFRSLAMTLIMEKLGYRYEVPDLQLSHSKGDKLRQAYDRTEFVEERTRMMQDWSDYIDELRKM